MKHIGIILAHAPAYSETFLNSKIRNLMDGGYRVTVFTQADVKGKYFFNHKKAYPSSGLLFLIYLIPVMLILLVLRLRIVLRFLKLALSEQYSLVNACKNCYLNAHIIFAAPDWIHFEFATLVLQREHLAKSMGAKLSVSCRGFDITLSPLLYPNCFQRLWRYIDKLHTLSDDLVLHAKREGMPDTIHVEKITPAIDASLFPTKGSAGIFGDTLQLITIGRLHWIKGIDYQIKSAALLRDAGIDFQWTIIGDGAEKEHYQFLISKYRLTDKVQLVGKRKPEEIASLLRQADIYVQYSHSEGFCNAVLEAQSSGLITIVSNGGALPENVIDGETGFVVPKRDPVALSKKIIEVYKMPSAKLQELALKASSRVHQEFNLELQNQKFSQFYQ